jgi:hypothetical protein
VLGGLVERPMSWLPAGHRAIAAGEKARAEERDDRRGRDVSERERAGERARAGRVAGLTRPAAPRTRASERASVGAVGPSQREKGGVGPR